MESRRCLASEIILRRIGAGQLGELDTPCSEPSCSSSPRVIGWRFFGARADVLEPASGPVVTVMDFGRSFTPAA